VSVEGVIGVVVALLVVAAFAAHVAWEFRRGDD